MFTKQKSLGKIFPKSLLLFLSFIYKKNIWGTFLNVHLEDEFLRIRKSKLIVIDVLSDLNCVWKMEELILFLDNGVFDQKLMI